MKKFTRWEIRQGNSCLQANNGSYAANTLSEALSAALKHRKNTSREYSKYWATCPIKIVKVTVFEQEMCDVPEL